MCFFVSALCVCVCVCVMDVSALGGDISLINVLTQIYSTSSLGVSQVKSGSDRPKWP